MQSERIVKLFENPGIYAALGALLTAIATLLLYLNQRKQLAIHKKPVLLFIEKIINKEPREYGLFLFNYGRGPALNIRIPEDIAKESEFEAFHQIPRNLMPYDKNENYTIFLKGYNNPIINENTYWIVEYEDINGNIYKTTISNNKHKIENIRD